MAIPGVKKGVRTTHPDYDAHSAQWQRVRDAVAGQDAVHTAGERYLPKLRDQDNSDYKAYLLRAPWYNASARTISGFVGMMFRKPPKIEAAAGLDDLLKNVDMSGTPIEVFIQEIADECVETGFVGVLTDYTPAPKLGPGEMMTVAKAEAQNLRPTLNYYCAESIINWKFKQVNNTWQLVMVVLTEEVSIPGADEFENACETRYRVLDLSAGVYRVRIFRINERDEDELVSEDVPLMNGVAMTAIPFDIITPDGLKFDVDTPPLLDLVDLNFAHYRVAADYEHGCHFTALPTFYISGYDAPVVENGETPEKIYLGSQAAIVLADPQARAGFVEFTGQGLMSIEKNLDRKESQMAVLGARMLAPEKKQAETATTSAIHRTGENSILASIAIAVSLALTKQLTTFSVWAGKTGQCVVELNRDFLPVNIDGPSLTAYVQAWQAGAINDEEFYDILQRGDVIDAKQTFEQHKAGSFSIVADPTAPPKGDKKPSDPGIQSNPAPSGS